MIEARKEVTGLLTSARLRQKGPGKRVWRGRLKHLACCVDHVLARMQQSVDPSVDCVLSCAALQSLCWLHGGPSCVGFMPTDQWPVIRVSARIMLPYGTRPGRGAVLVHDALARLS